MKLLLVQTITDSPEGPVFPIGLGYLAAALPSDCEVRAIDMNVERDPYRSIQELVCDFVPNAVCLSIRNIKIARPGEHISSLSEIRDTIERISPAVDNILIVAGGAGFSLYAESIMKAIPQIFCGIVGEGEIALPALISQFPDPAGVKGVIYRKDGEIVAQGIAERPDFAKLPWPKRDIFRMDAYAEYPTSVGIMTKRGCPFRCIHCSDLYLLGEHVRTREPEDIVEELRHLKKDYRVSRFMFADQTFNVPSDHTKNLLRQMAKADLDMEWTAYFSPKDVDEEIFSLFKKSGCYMISFSPDCCTDKMMKELKKGFVMEDLFRANRLAKKVELPVTYNFMLGLPGERMRDLLQTLFFVFRSKLQLRSLLKLHGLFVAPVRIYPHTELRDMAVRDKLIEASDDLMQPRFFRVEKALVNLADKITIGGITLLWKIKHMLFH